MTTYYREITGNSHNCETCGLNTSRLEVEYDSEVDAWSYRHMWGCYSGNGAEEVSYGAVIAYLGQAIREPHGLPTHSIADLRLNMQGLVPGEFDETWGRYDE